MDAGFVYRLYMRMSAGDASRPPVFGGNIRERERVGNRQNNNFSEFGYTWKIYREVE
jgi:hypothetical protein